MKMKRGALIIFEGCDRSGKTTQCQRLVKYLSENLPMIGEGLTAAKMMRFPDRETEIGKTISGYLKQEQHLEDQVVHLLFSANRWERRLDLVKALEAGQHVIVDRYVFSEVFNVTFLNRKWISPRKLIPAQGKVYPRAVFTPRGSALQPRAKRGL